MAQRKLTKEMATSIRHLFKHLGYTQKQLAYMFCVSVYTIKDILHNITYGDVEYDPSYIPDTPLLDHYNKHIKTHYLYHNLEYEQCVKLINGFPHYVICIDGTIFSDINLHYTKIKPQLSTNGYVDISLSHNHTKTKKKLHILIAETFIENPHNLPFVLHRDDNKSNNNLDNLYFGTHKDNVLDAQQNGKYFNYIPDCTKKEIARTIDLIPTISNTELVKRFNVSAKSIRKIRKEYNKTNV